MDLSNKLCVVSGASSGFRKEIVRAFARQGAYTLMLCRNKQHVLQAMQGIPVTTDFKLSLLT
ncbi:hypothetical protein [Fodinibius sediminis]|uniref:Short chain dehydrogenase n=1 Tax=Fodinibius sediminis TaxID=1214077 RepID=A0A521DX55_9BACT|nr:hypothetical protein [Fodinibius sediminis]SMO76287.1 hypothetical protein SAMN06265218_11231 [Fodinibius sediminis]